LSDAPSATFPQSLEAPKAPPGAELRFLSAAVAIGLLLFGLFRVPWVQARVLIPYAQAQQQLAGALLGLERPTVAINFSCTGADVIALCLAAVLAFPAPWRRRLAGAAFGLLLISVVNTVRIGSLSLAAGRNSLYQTLHVVVWPAVLVVAVSLYVFLWMRWVARTRARLAAPAVAAVPERAVLVRFACWLVPLVVLYFAASSWYLQSDWIRAAARLTARTGALLFGLFGATASALGPSLATAHASYRVTPLCLASPLVPVYYAAVLALPMAWTRRAVWLLAGPLVFFALATARLLVLALPAAVVPSYASAIHAFNQLVLGCVLVLFAALWSRRREGDETSRSGGASTALRMLTAVVLGVAAAAVGALWGRALLAVTSTAQASAGHAGHAFVDPQSALALLPAYQLGLFAALVYVTAAPGARPGRRFAAATAILLASQFAVYVAAGEVWAHLRFVVDAREVRGWSVLAPVLAAWWAGGFGPRALWPSRRSVGPAPLPERA
jgi:exosortase/archaeosortase family protein